LFSGQAAHDVSVQDIIDAADLAKGSFYNHFTHKTELVEAIMRETRNKVSILVDAANQGVADPSKRIARAICTVVRFCVDNRRSAAALMKLEASFPSLDEKLNMRAEEAIIAGIREGAFSKVGREEGLLLAIGACAITIQHCLTKDIAEAGRLTTAMVAGVLRALGVTPGKAARIARQSVSELLLDEKM
jgi:AcrR family transcriptional regulator